MPSYNKVILVGHLTRDPETRQVGTESGVTSFSIAVNESWKNAAGEKQERVAFIDCEAWNKTGSIIMQYFAKGKPILVEGKIQQDNWEDKQTGAKRSKLKVNVSNFSFIGGDKNDEVPVRQVEAAAKVDGSPLWKGGPATPVDDSDIPF